MLWITRDDNGNYKMHCQEIESDITKSMDGRWYSFGSYMALISPKIMESISDIRLAPGEGPVEIRIELLEHLKKLESALAESLLLQSHYAELLNMNDGGKRMKFSSVESWLLRLESLKNNEVLTEGNRSDD